MGKSTQPLPRDLWRQHAQEAQRQAARLLRLRGGDPLAAGDLSQEALLRLWGAQQRGESIPSPGPWLVGTMRHLLADWAREALACPSTDRLTPGNGELLADPDPRADVVGQAVLRDLWVYAPGLFERLPPPLRQIATLQYLSGWTRRDIVAWLRRWRPIGKEEARKQIKRTHRALVSICGLDQEPGGGGQCP
jgi:DNA-directed RNA polymerase specialized sigma24 family protein